MKKLLLVLFVILPMLLSAQNLTVTEHSKKNLYGYWGEKRNGKEGYVIPPKFEEAHPFVGEYAFVCYKGIWGIIGKDGKFVVEPQFDSASKPFGGITIVRQGEKFGLFKNGENILPFQYDKIEPFEDGGFKLSKGVLNGLTDINGKVIISVEYENITTYNGGYKLKANGRIGLADASGKVFIPVEYEDIATYNGTYKLKAKGCVGLADASGNVIIPVAYEDVTTYNGAYKLKANRRIGIADASGKIVIPIEFEDVLVCGEGFAVKDNGLYGLVDANGKVVFDIKYKDIISLQNGLFAIYTDKWEFINKEGKSVEQPGNVILYTTKDGKVKNRTHNDTWKDNVTAHVCHDGQCVMVFNSSIANIANNIFARCDNLISITIPNGVTSIAREAFSGCYNLTSVTFPNSIIDIGDSAFRNCCSLVSIDLPDSVKYIQRYAFQDCTSLTSITIPKSVVWISTNAFGDCRALTKVAVSGNIELDHNVFYRCIKLERVDVDISDLAAFSSKNEISKIPCAVHLYINGKEITNLVIPNGVTSIGNSVFWDCENLRSITIPKSVKKIGAKAFCNCDNITSVTISNGVTEIGEDAFYGCDNLANVTIPNSVTWIRDSAFAYCDKLTRITIPDSVTSIGEKAFYGCCALKTVYCNSTVPPYLGSSVFDYENGPLCCTVYVPAASRTMYLHANSWRKYILFIRTR